MFSVEVSRLPPKGSHCNVIVNDNTNKCTWGQKVSRVMKERFKWKDESESYCSHSKQGSGKPLKMAAIGRIEQFI